MTSRTHDIGAFTGLLVAVVLSPTIPNLSLGTLIACIFANQFGGIAPDIDQPTAPFWRHLPVGGFIGRIITKMLGGHRFLTHSILGMFAMSWLVRLLLAFISPILPTINMHYVWLAFIIGMLSHLVLDSLTKEGVPWLLPLPIKFGFPPARRGRLTTGEFTEKFIIFPALTIGCMVLIATHYDVFKSVVLGV
jgi:inner membrane protein